MDDPFALPLRPRFAPQELALTALGVATIFCLVARGEFFNPVSLKVVAATLVYASLLLVSQGREGRLAQALRLLLSYTFVVWFYIAVARITPALATKLLDGALLAIDEALFGKTPSVFCDRFATATLTDVLSICYMTYHLYLPLAVIHAAVAGDRAARCLGIYLFTAFALGFAGYLLVPAIGPARAWPELFERPLPGGALFRFIDGIVTKGSSGYDVFPSLHVLITSVLLDHDWRHVRRRFWIMVAPCVGLLISTIYLRYHYGLDILAGFLIFAALRTLVLKTRVGELSSCQ